MTRRELEEARCQILPDFLQCPGNPRYLALPWDSIWSPAPSSPYDFVSPAVDRPPLKCCLEEGPAHCRSIGVWPGQA